jgi:dolichyl-diphosphooligosaccharide--protein glycosyltransferase
MKATAWVCGLLVVLLVALSLRERSAPAFVVPVGASLPSGSLWQIEDQDAAYHLRRVQVALATGSVPDFDRFINHPDGSPVPWPTFFDGLLAVIVETFLDPSPDGEPDLGGYREADVEGLLVHVPPALGVVAALGCVLLVLAAASRDGSVLRGPAAWWALFGAFVFATVPTAVMYGTVARIDHHVATSMFLALQLACAARALVARDAIESNLLAAQAGLFGALGILTWLAHGVFLGLCGVAFAQRALSRDPLESRRGWHGGAVFFAVAMLVVLWPAATSPWNATQPGSLINLSTGVTRALGAAAVPFLVFGLAGRRTSHRGLRSAAGALALVAVVLLLPSFLAQLREGLQWADRTNQFMAVIDESAPMTSKAKHVFGVSGIDGHLGYLWYAMPVAGLLLLLRPRPERVLLVLTTALLFYAALKQRRFADALSVPMAATLALGALEIGRLAARVVPARLAALPHAVVALAALWPLWSTTAIALRWGEDQMRGNATRWNFIISGLRWMRDNTPSPGPWNEPHSVPSYGVLASWSDGHLIEYHARRPTIATNFGSFVGIENFQAAPRALLENDPDEFVRKLEALGVRYVVMRPAVLSWFMDEARVAGWTREERQTLWNPDRSYSTRALTTPYFQLALHDQAVGEFARRFPALELVWRSPIRVGIGGAAAEDDVVLAGPSLSIWRVIGE